MAVTSRARSYRQRVRVMRDAVQMDGGRSLDQPTQVAEVSAAVVPLAGRELILVRQSLPEVTHRVETWYRRDIGPTNWLEHNGRRLAIVECVDVEERRKWLQLLCVEQTGGG